MKKMLVLLLAVGAGALVIANTVASGAATARVAIVHVQKAATCGVSEPLRLQTSA
jgi:hypothetical protein